MHALNMDEYSMNCATSHLIITFRSEDLSVVTLSICRPCSVAKFTMIVFAARGSILELLETLGTKHRIMNKILLQYTMDFSATQRPTIFLDFKDCTMYVQCLAVHPKNKILVKKQNNAFLLTIDSLQYLDCHTCRPQPGQ